MLLPIICYFRRSSRCCEANNWHIINTQTNSTKENRERAKEDYSPSETFQNLKNRRTISELDTSRSGTGYSKKKSGKEEGRFCLLGTINGPGYTTAKLRTVYIASFVKKPTIINMLNDTRVENSFIKTRYFNWKHARSITKIFLNMSPQTVTNQLSKD